MKTLTWNEFVENVQAWAKERGIYEHSTPQAQLLKALSELGELADGVIKDDIDAVKDGIGDVAVCLVNYATMVEAGVGAPKYDEHEHGDDFSHVGFLAEQIGTNLQRFNLLNKDRRTFICFDDLLYIAASNELDFLDCCEHAWNEIKDRKGRMVAGGAFVKDE